MDELENKHVRKERMAGINKMNTSRHKNVHSNQDEFLISGRPTKATTATLSTKQISPVSLPFLFIHI